MATEDTVEDTVAPVLDTVAQTVASTLSNPSPLAELGFGLLVLVAIIGVHGWWVGTVSQRFADRMDALSSSSPRWRVNALVGVTIALLVVAHLFETLIWAIPIWKMGLISDFRGTYLFVLEAYTTLGEGTIKLPPAWQLVGPMISISGLFTFSWTGSVLVYVMSESSQRKIRRIPTTAEASTGQKHFAQDGYTTPILSSDHADERTDNR